MVRASTEWASESCSGGMNECCWEEETKKRGSRTRNCSNYSSCSSFSSLEYSNEFEWSVVEGEAKPYSDDFGQRKVGVGNGRIDCVVVAVVAAVAVDGNEWG